MNKKEMTMKHGTTVKTFTIAAVVALALTIAPIAKAEGKGCSNATLSGTFADKDAGFITAPSELAGPFAGVNLEIFDGHGGLSGRGIVSINGNVFQGTYSGTYTVSRDCTGTPSVVR
jgi:hypothetical protein